MASHGNSSQFWLVLAYTASLVAAFLAVQRLLARVQARRCYVRSLDRRDRREFRRMTRPWRYHRNAIELQERAWWPW